MIAVIRVRGKVNVSKAVNDTLDMLRLYDKNYCVFIDDKPTTKGMLNKVKDFVTYGEVSEEVFKEVVSKRGEEYKGRISDSKGKIKYDRKFFTHEGKKYKRFFRLNAPKKGYGRKGIKKPFSLGGALGDRKEKIADLIKRMV